MTPAKRPPVAPDPSDAGSGTAEVDETEALRARIAQLEADNAALHAAGGADDSDASAGDDDAPAAPGGRTRGSRWWGALSAVLIVIASLLTPVSIVGAWARAELVDVDRFVATFGPLIDDAHVQALVIDQVTDAIDEQLDIAGLTDALFDGIASLDLPPRAAAALELLRVPAAQGAQSLVDQTVTRVVTSDAFSDVWSSALRASHRALEVAATGGTGGAVSIDEQGVVGLELGPIIAEVKDRLIERGLSFASVIPVVDRTIVIVQSDALVTVRVVYGIAVAVGWWLPVVALILFVAGVLVARRRSTALLGAGLGLAFGAGALAVGLGIGDAVMAFAAAQVGVPSAALGAVYAQVVDAMRQTAIVLSVIGLVIALLAWSQGRWRAAVATRRAVGAATVVVRDGLTARGVDTGGFGAWMDRNRALVRVLIAVLAVVWLWLLRPLGVGEIFFVLIVSLVLWWLCELVRRAPAAASVDADS